MLLISCSSVRLRKMPVLGIALVRTLRRYGIELQRRIVQRLESDLAGIETRNRKLAHQTEESATHFFIRARLLFEPQRLQQRSLLFRRQVHESLPTDLLGMYVQPSKPGAEGVLWLRIARHHEINKLRHARFLRSWR